MNSRPPPYQGGALPLSYRSLPNAADFCHISPASARRVLGPDCNAVAGGTGSHKALSSKWTQRVTGKADSGGKDGKAERQNRLADALRANLQRRKAQARQREAKPGACDEARPAGAASGAADKDAGQT